MGFAVGDDLLFVVEDHLVVQEEVATDEAVNHHASMLVNCCHSVREVNYSEILDEDGVLIIKVHRTHFARCFNPFKATHGKSICIF